jgi:hypothetical protein
MKKIIALHPFEVFFIQNGRFEECQLRIHNERHNWAY